MNATPPHAFDLASDRFDLLVASAFASGKTSRHVRDDLIAQVDSGRLDRLLPRARCGVATLPDAVNRKAALNIIDFAFEPLVLQSMSTDQAAGYLSAIEDTLHIREARGVDGFGPLWVDTVHHVCVFSVLFKLAMFLGRNRGFGHVILLHQGQRPEPRLRIVSNLLRQAHGIVLTLLPLQGPWFPRLARIATPGTIIFYLTDMPPEAFPRTARMRQIQSRLLLTYGMDGAIPAETVSGSQSFARRLGATRVVLDYPSTDSVSIRPPNADEATTSYCPLEDWVFWPLLGSPVGLRTSRAVEGLARG